MSQRSDLHGRARHRALVLTLLLVVAGCSTARKETAWSPRGRCEFVALHEEAFGQVETLSVVRHQSGHASRLVWREVGDAPGRPIAWRNATDVEFEQIVDGRPRRRRLHLEACGSRS